jgi:hypothetical protein
MEGIKKYQGKQNDAKKRQKTEGRPNKVPGKIEKRGIFQFNILILL